MNIQTQMEFAVDMTCNSCADTVKNALSNKPINVIAVNVEKQQLIIESNLPFQEIQSIIEETGKRAILLGHSSSTSHNLGAAVIEMAGANIKGVVRMVQFSNDNCLIEGTVDGLSPGKHGINIHEYGDLSNHCFSCGDHFNPYNQKHGGEVSKEKHVGDLGNITAMGDGRAHFQFFNSGLRISDVIGRSMVVHEKEDDLGLGCNEKSKVDGNAGPGVACGIIARSAGLFENKKRICSCDGIPIWDERDVPVAGKERQKL